MSAVRTLPSRRTALAALLGTALAPAVATAQLQDEFGRAGLQGAGSTFVHPLAARWVREYRHHLAGGIAHATPNAGLDDDMIGAALDYEPVGSLAGMARLRAGAVDFALSEVPLSSAELRRQRLVQFPIVLGGIAVAAHVPGLGGELRLSGPVLADIYGGRIQRWNDAAIRALNPQLALPDATIAVVGRSDGSGTTFTLTHYLAGQSADWRAGLGADAQVRWPVGRGVRGSAGMAEALRRTPHALGYLDAVQARQAGLTVVALRNAAGAFVAPSAAATAHAAQAARWDAARDFSEVLVDSPGAASYPIVATVFGLMRDSLRSGRQQRTLAWFDWALIEGRLAAEQLGYVPLPMAVIGTVRETLAARAASL